MDIRRAASITLSLWLLFPTIALANGNNFDEPPPNTNARSGGSRGFSTGTTSLDGTPDGTPPLILLAPTQHDRQTVSTRPTFAWLVSAPGSWQMEFRLYQYDPVTEEAKLVAEIKDPNFKSSSGIVVLSSSESIPALSIGQRYLWQVELICDPNRPSGNPFAEAEIEVVESQPSLKAELANTNNAFNRAAVYAKAGLWYDALGVILTAQQNPRLAELKFSLVDEVAAGVKERVKLRKSAIHKMQR